MIRRRPVAGGRIPLCISYCRNFNTRPQNVSERMWRNHAQEMYKNFSFIVTWRTKCGVINKIGCDFLCSFASFHRERRGIAALFRHVIDGQFRQNGCKNVVKTKKVSACAPSFSEILFENVDYLTRKCATWPRRFLYTESTNHPEHPCAPSGRHVRRAAATWDTHLIIVQEAIT